MRRPWLSTATLPGWGSACGQGARGRAGPGRRAGGAGVEQPRRPAEFLSHTWGRGQECLPGAWGELLPGPPRSPAHVEEAVPQDLDEVRLRRAPRGDAGVDALRLERLLVADLGACAGAVGKRARMDAQADGRRAPAAALPLRLERPCPGQAAQAPLATSTPASSHLPRAVQSAPGRYSSVSTRELQYSQCTTGTLTQGSPRKLRRKRSALRPSAM